MKIQEAQKAYSAHLNTLLEKKQVLTDLLQDCENTPGGAGNFDRVEISRELSAVDTQYEAVKGVLSDITAARTAIHNAEVAKQQGEVLSEAAEEIGNMMEIYRRIASGGEVPHRDEQRLMEYSKELYMAAKAAAILTDRGDGEKYDSLFEDETPAEAPEKSAHEIAGETDIAVPTPEQMVSAMADGAFQI